MVVDPDRAKNREAGQASSPVDVEVDPPRLPYARAALEHATPEGVLFKAIYGNLVPLHVKLAVLHRNGRRIVSCRNVVT